MRGSMLVVLFACGSRTASLGGECTRGTLAEPVGLVLSAQLDDADVYWASGGGSAGPDVSLARTPKMGGDTKSLAVGSYGSFAIDEQRLYWTMRSGTHASVWSQPKDGGGAIMIAPDIDSQAHLAIADDRLVITSPSTAEIVTMPKAGGAFTTIVSSTKVYSPIVSDGNAIYFAAYANSSYVLRRIAKDGGAPVELFESRPNECVRQLVLGRAQLYVVEYSCPGDKVAIDVRRIPKSGGAASVLSGMGGPIAVDGDDVIGTNMDCEVCASKELAVIRSDGTVLFRPATGVEVQALAAERSAIYIGVNTFFRSGEKPRGALLKLCL